MSIKSMNMPTMDELVSFRREFITQFDSRQTPFLLLLFRPVNLHTLLSLNAKELWFSHPQDFNDPFDCSKVIHLYKGSTDYTSVLHEIRIRSFANINNINNMLLWSHYADGHKGIAITIAPNYPLLKKNNIVQVLHMLMKSYVVVVNNALKNVRIMDWNMMKQHIRCILMKQTVLDVDVV